MRSEPVGAALDGRRLSPIAWLLKTPLIQRLRGRPALMYPLAVLAGLVVANVCLRASSVGGLKWLVVFMGLDLCYAQNKVNSW